MKLAFLMILTAFVISGCTAVFDQKTQQKTIGSTVDYGDYPTNYITLVHAQIKATFKDPDSVKDLEILEPKPFKFLNFDGQTYAQTDVFGYLITYSCNAKNSYGGYTGIKVHFLKIRIDSQATNAADRMVLGDN